MSEEAKTLHQKLLAVQREVKYLQKDGSGQGFGYVSSSMALASVRTKMDELGLLLACSVVDHTVHVEGAYTHKTTKQHLTEMTFEFTWINVDDPKDRETFRWYGQGIDTGEKGVGKAATYAEKYFLLKFFHVATGDDDPDRFQEEHEPAAPPAPPPGLDEAGTPQNLTGLVNALKLDGVPQSYCAKAAEYVNLDWDDRKTFTPEQLQSIRERAGEMHDIDEQEANEAVSA